MADFANEQARGLDRAEAAAGSPETGGNNVDALHANLLRDAGVLAAACHADPKGVERFGHDLAATKAVAGGRPDLQGTLGRLDAAYAHRVGLQADVIALTADFQAEKNPQALSHLSAAAETVAQNAKLSGVRVAEGGSNATESVMGAGPDAALAALRQDISTPA